MVFHGFSWFNYTSAPNFSQQNHHVLPIFGPAKADPWGPRARRAADRTGQPGREAMVYLQKMTIYWQKRLIYNNLFMGFYGTIVIYL